MNWGGATQLFSGGYHYDPLVSLSIFYLKCNFFPKRILFFFYGIGCFGEFQSNQSTSSSGRN